MWTHLRHGRVVDPPRHDRVVGPPPTRPGVGPLWTLPVVGPPLDMAGRGSILDNGRVAELSAMAGWSHSRLGEVWSHIAAIAAGPVFFSSGKFALLWRWLVWHVCPGSSDSSRPTTSRPGGPSGGRPLRVTVRTPSPKTGRPQRRLAKAGPTRRSWRGGHTRQSWRGGPTRHFRRGGHTRRSWRGGRTRRSARVDPPDTSGGWSHPRSASGGSHHRLGPLARRRLVTGRWSHHRSGHSVTLCSLPPSLASPILRTSFRRVG
jgi:hypothetical protein